jgi:hypothetical protein
MNVMYLIEIYFKIQYLKLLEQALKNKISDHRHQHVVHNSSHTFHLLRVHCMLLQYFQV